MCSCSPEMALFKLNNRYNHLNQVNAVIALLTFVFDRTLFGSRPAVGGPTMALGYFLQLMSCLSLAILAHGERHKLVTHIMSV